MYALMFARTLASEGFHLAVSLCGTMVTLCLQNDGTFYLIDDVPKFAKYMSEPIKSQQSASPLDTPGYFVAGIVKGYLVSSGFPAEYAHHLLDCGCSIRAAKCVRICRRCSM
jgi:hypothetical protein